MLVRNGGEGASRPAQPKTWRTDMQAKLAHPHQIHRTLSRLAAASLLLLGGCADMKLPDIQIPKLNLSQVATAGGGAQNAGDPANRHRRHGTGRAVRQASHHRQPQPGTLPVSP